MIDASFLKDIQYKMSKERRNLKSGFGMGSLILLMFGSLIFLVTIKGVIFIGNNPQLLLL